jgi:hypothetical protein
LVKKIWPRRTVIVRSLSDSWSGSCPGALAAAALPAKHPWFLSNGRRVLFGNTFAIQQAQMEREDWQTQVVGVRGKSPLVN